MSVKYSAFGPMMTLCNYLDSAPYDGPNWMSLPIDASSTSSQITSNFIFETYSVVLTLTGDFSSLPASPGVLSALSTKTVTSFQLNINGSVVSKVEFTPGVSFNKALVAIELLNDNNIIQEVYSGHDIFVGSEQTNNEGDNDWINGYAGNDTFHGNAPSTGQYNDQFYGNAGVDTAVFRGNNSDYSVTSIWMSIGDGVSQQGISVTDRQTSRDGVTSLLSVERLQFADKTVALDIDGNAGQAYRLYQAAFARTPDNGGLKYWISNMDNGATLEQVSTGFLASNEFKSVYGANPTIDVFLNNLYQNVLHRTPDAGGYDYWANQIKTGLINEQVLIGFSESNENIANVIGVIQNGIELF